MSPDEVQVVEPGTHLRSNTTPDVGVGRLEAYFDVIHGKIGTVSYGFREGELVYGAYRFNLDQDDRVFSQTMGEQMRSTYGEAEHVEASKDGGILRLHWSTSQTKVIAQFAPTSLQVKFWEVNYWAQHTNQPAPTNPSGR